MKKVEVKINREIRQYTESIFFGLSIRQFAFSICACGVAVILYFLFHGKLNGEIVSWICIMGAAPFAACLPDRAFPDKSSNLAAGRPERGPARCPCDPAGRNHPCPDSDRADAFAQAGRKPRAYRDLRCAVRSSVGRGLLWV